jgi:hypothetical protein
MSGFEAESGNERLIIVQRCHKTIGAPEEPFRKQLQP